jgi:hypothetical protein
MSLSVRCEVFPSVSTIQADGVLTGALEVSLATRVHPWLGTLRPWLMSAWLCGVLLFSVRTTLAWRQALALTLRDEPQLVPVRTASSGFIPCSGTAEHPTQRESQQHRSFRMGHANVDNMHDGPTRTLGARPLVRRRHPPLLEACRIAPALSYFPPQSAMKFSGRLQVAPPFTLVNTGAQLAKAELLSKEAEMTDNFGTPAGRLSLSEPG